MDYLNRSLMLKDPQSSQEHSGPQRRHSLSTIPGSNKARGTIETYTAQDVGGGLGSI